MATAFDGRVTLYGANTRKVIQQLHVRYGTSATSTAALGRAISIGAMLAAMQKPGESTTINIYGNGPIGYITVTANHEGLIEGSVESPIVNLKLNEKNKIDVGGAIGKGDIEVIKSEANSTEVKTVFPIVSGEFGDDFTYYFAKKMNIPSAVVCGELINPDSNVKKSGAFIIQISYSLSDSEITEIERKLNGMESLSSQLNDGKSIEKILESIVGPIKIIERKTLKL
jgi:molecular chaperone Hsp33